MNTRSSRELVTFPRSFQLTGMDKMLPAGTYEVTTEEEQIGDFVYEAYRRISTSIYLPAQRGDHGIGQIVSIDPDELADTLKKTSALEVDNPEEST